MTSFRLRRLAVLTALIVSLAACGGGGDDDDAVGTSDESSSTTADDSVENGGDDGATDGGGETTDTTAAGGDAGAGGDGGQAAQTTTTAGGGGGGGTAAAPSTPIVPKSGTYTYQRKVQSDQGNEDDTTDVLVERLSGDDAAGKLRVTLESPQGQLVNDMSADANGSLVTKSVIESAMGQITCDWAPDWALNGAYQVGSSWTVDSKCSDTVGTLKVAISLKGTGTVVGTEVIDVAGRSVTAWVIETKMVTDIVIESPTVSGTQHTESTAKNWIDPSLGMNVKGVSDDVNSGDFASGNSHTETALVSSKLT